MKLSQGFAPVACTDAKILILGSIPGVASLDANQYYAFARNAFWRIMGELYDAGPELSYPSRLQILTSNHVALWDVIDVCHRPGSLDSAIAADGLISNDFNGFFAQHPQISQVFFNGQNAAILFKKNVLPGLNGDYKCYAGKLQAWSIIKPV